MKQNVLASFQFPFRFDPIRLKADLERISPDEWVPHFNTNIYEGEWSGVALRSIAGHALQLYPDPTATGSFTDTALLARCPSYQEVLATFRCPLTSVRLLRLKARSSIREHRDYKLGWEDGEMRIHIPIVTNPAVAFFVNGERVPMQEGETWYVNVNLPHRVDNESDTDRIHLVVDCVVNDWLTSLLPVPANAVPYVEQSR